MDKFYCITNEIQERAGLIKEKFLDEIKAGNLVIFGSGACGHRIYNLLCSYHKKYYVSATMVWLVQSTKQQELKLSALRN